MKRTDLSPIPIPITVLTGFLGSGKTTVLDYLGRTGALSRTLVLVNEFGEVGLDHELLVPIDDAPAIFRHEYMTSTRGHKIDDALVFEQAKTM